MNRFRYVVLGVLALLGLALFSACGGGDDKTFATDDGEVKISDDLSDEFPDDFPIYDGADLQGSYQGENQGIQGVVATWTTGDSVDDVKSFYADKLDDGWKIQSSGDSAGTAFFIATNSDESQAAYVTISGTGDETTILVAVGDNPGDISGDDSSDEETPDDGDSSGDSGDDGTSGDGDSGNADLPEEQDLSDDYPSDRVPLPDDIRVTGSTSLATGGTESHYIEFYSKKSADELADYFKDTLPGKGWSEAITTNTGGDVYIAFTSSDSTETSSGVTITITDAPVDGYRLVNVGVVGA